MLHLPAGLHRLQLRRRCVDRPTPAPDPPAQRVPYLVTLWHPAPTIPRRDALPAPTPCACGPTSSRNGRGTSATPTLPTSTPPARPASPSSAGWTRPPPPCHRDRRNLAAGAAPFPPFGSADRPGSSRPRR